MGNFRVVFQTMKDHQLYAKYTKCNFWLRLVTFLGHIICSEGVEVEPRKMEEVKNFPRPLSVTDITSFLASEGYYKRFVIILRPLLLDYFDQKD